MYERIVAYERYLWVQITNVTYKQQHPTHHQNTTNINILSSSYAYIDLTANAYNDQSELLFVTSLK